MGGGGIIAGPSTPEFPNPDAGNPGVSAFCTFFDPRSPPAEPRRMVVIVVGLISVLIFQDVVNVLNRPTR